ncbi:carboxymuconolactone decarboxylase family protein [Pedobacter xixiisoli]|uniref:Alkylhydroperoxidase AhpD family core domain-containing protein n=1 Tax=Pedobacter xixiisoli TaxID=1476464 RepID=A0A286A0K2_9SPHI|nr:carboxymuconolactone decarboxylase family protein [Pedobacter xixiisoli]SOD15426.1 alkylhydroperoxidase AhpD family core domain-containing protein [Pedobacter xixiisoli]
MKRLDISKLEPNAYKAMYGLENYLLTTSLEKSHKELIKIRASQINGCAFCLDMHTKDAIKLGETPQRIFLLNAWRETDLFSAEEKIILGLTEKITLISQCGVDDDLYKKAVDTFGESYVAQIIMACVAINAWNRIAISTNLEVPKS